MPDRTTVSLGGRQLSAERARLGLFLELQHLSTELEKAIEKRDSGASANAMIGYIEKSVKGKLEGHFSWMEIGVAFSLLQELNAIPEKIPMLRLAPSVSKRPVPWDYPGRNMVWWVHLIARAYSWSYSDILQLWPEEAAKFVQEILVDDQLDREFFHSLSEVAYAVNKGGKARYVPLRRPMWMLTSGTLRKIKIPKEALPKGEVVDMSGFGSLHGN